MLIKEEEFDPVPLIYESIGKLKQKTIVKCVKLALHLIYE